MITNEECGVFLDNLGTKKYEDYFFLYEFNNSHKLVISRIMRKYVIAPSGKDAVISEINKIIEIINGHEVILKELQEPKPNHAYLYALEDITTRLYNYQELSGRKLELNFKDYLGFLTTYVKPTQQNLKAITNKINSKHNNQNQSNKKKYAP